MCTVCTVCMVYTVNRVCIYCSLKTVLKTESIEGSEGARTWDIKLEEGSIVRLGLSLQSSVFCVQLL